MNEQTPMAVKSRDAAPADSPFSWLRQEFDRFFGDVAHPARGIFNFGAQLAPLPAIELNDEGERYCLTAELPGLSEADVEITVADGILTLSGEKREAQDRRGDGVSVSERRYGAFSRQVRLPADVDADKITADITKGVLTVSMAKDADAGSRARRIEIGKA